jgi:hypothetical protein
MEHHQVRLQKERYEAADLGCSRGMFQGPKVTAK